MRNTPSLPQVLEEDAFSDALPYMPPTPTPPRGPGAYPYSTMLISTSPSSPTMAWNDTFGVVLTCVGPCPRDASVGEQGSSPHLQLHPHKQPQPYHPALLHLAYPHRPHNREAPGLPSNPETLEAPPASAFGFYEGGGSHLRPFLWLGDEWGGGQGARSLLHWSRVGEGLLRACGAQDKGC
jgi:hypothetical protein